MSYTSTDLITYAVGDGTTGTIATPPFEVDSDIVVLVRASGENTASTWVLDTDYTLSGAGTGANGTLTPITTKPSGATIVIYTDPAPTLTFDFSSLPTALQSPLKSALHQLSLQVRSLKAAQRQYIKTSIFDLVAKNNAGTAAIDADRLGKLLLWNASTGAPDVIATADFIGPAGQAGAGATPDGRTILEASPVTDASAEFLSGGTFTLDPTNARHYNVQVGDSETALTAGMTIDLAPDSASWPDTAQVIITKGDSSGYTVTVSGLNADGAGTYALTEQYEGVILGYHHTDDDDGPGAAGQKFKIVGRFTRTRQQDIADYVETNAHLKTDGNLLPDGTIGIVTLDDAGDPVVSQTSGDGTIQVSAAGLVTAVAKLGATTYPWTDITASRNLSSADAWFSITTGSAAASYLSFQTLQVNPDPKSTAIALGIPNDLPTGDYLIFVPGDQTGAVTLTIVDAATINGDTNTVTLYAGRYTLLKVYNGGSAPEVQTSPTLDDGLGIAVAASGTLPMSYAGYTVLTSGGVTIPTTIGNGGRGLHGVLRGGGAHTVTFNSSTYETLAAGDIFPFMVIDVSSTPTLIGKKIAAADLAAP